ncbi:MAG: glycogen synthase [Candidatus Dadabacteria bacterium]|nr:glycogen synthase [Candidatus Dadabacteria bacterium]NIS08642.1 glycogen synthase [Candidatus Dadabacteria bacterium]NIV42476.1 glycosyltransferase [Candidatus Dadabacteria bacterium]NIX15358.1 glycosyltransferase [Candidatus Dadabacteria bacterium]NIY22017.1 glycosyltransferase [Candidatus Dadabacteria bacterium]
MNILFITSEFDPLTNIGGLGEVTSSLSKELQTLGCNVKVVLPYYKNVKSNLQNLKIKPKSINKTITTCIDWLPVSAKIKEVTINEIDCYLVENKELFDRNYIYSAYGYEEGDDDYRFGFFSLCTLELAKTINFQPDIIHCHDWQTAFVPLFLQSRKHLKDDPFFKSSKVIFTIHNLFYQGEFDKKILEQFGLPEYLFTSQNIELKGKINMLKAGILYSNLITTVSENYAKEIINPEFGFGLDRVLRRVTQDSNKMHGILNGIDYKLHSPTDDKQIYKKYGIDSLENKKYNKIKLKKEFGIDTSEDKPIIAVISKLTDQRGIQLIIDSFSQIIDLGFQLFILGVGDSKYHKTLSQRKKKFEGNFCLILKQDESIARKAYAGADMILMPSKFEPCGLVQMIALRYGTIPVVRSTGGLVDTVRDYSEGRKPTGFVFKQFTKVNLLDTLIRAITVYEHKNEWTKLIKNAMKEDYSWKVSAKKYYDLYEKVINS